MNNNNSVATKIGIMISGTGSNMEAIIRACSDNIINGNVVCVVSNVATAAGLEKLKKYSIPSLSIEKTKKEFESDTLEFLESFGVNLLCLAGFMSILTQSFISKFPYDIINIHPSILPSFKGMNAQKQALEYGVKFTGCTVHYVTPEVDSGKIIAQSIVPILKNDTEQLLSHRIKKVEHPCYIEAIKTITE